MLQHKADLFSDLVIRWRDRFNAEFDLLLYDLTRTYFEINASDVAERDERRQGYSRDKRPDCPQMVIALVVTPDGLPLAYEVLPGNTADFKCPSGNFPSSLESVSTGGLNPLLCCDSWPGRFAKRAMSTIENRPRYNRDKLR